MSADRGVRLGFVIEVIEGDALKVAADVLAVKHVPSASGLGAQVRKRLKGDADLLPAPDEYRIFPGRAATNTAYVLMVGAPPVFALGYPQLRALSRRFLEALWEARLDAEHVATTLHGVRTGAGLDEVEAFRSLLLGLADAYEDGHYPPALRRVTFVENDFNRVRLMQDALRRFLPDVPAPPESSAPAPAREAADALLDDVLAKDAEVEELRAPLSPPAMRTREAAVLPLAEPSPDVRVTTGTQAVIAGPESFEPEYRKPEADEFTPHIFVAMPFRDEYDDQYYLAIQPTIHELGLLSERMDLDAFTGDIKLRMLERIRTARLLVALLDGGNPNVYLEVGYAWGVATPTILIARQGETLPFDVRGERMLLYDKIYRLKQMLRDELARLLGPEPRGE